MTDHAARLFIWSHTSDVLCYCKTRLFVRWLIDFAEKIVVKRCEFKLVKIKSLLRLLGCLNVHNVVTVPVH